MALICASLHAQTPPARPQFEVASVKAAANDEARARLGAMMRVMMRANLQPGMIPMEDPGRIRLDNYAVEKLGLKLEARKITVDTIVVDRVSKIPTAN